jgi:hypothetical protein
MVRRDGDGKRRVDVSEMDSGVPHVEGGGCIKSRPVQIYIVRSHFDAHRTLKVRISQVETIGSNGPQEVTNELAGCKAHSAGSIGHTESNRIFKGCAIEVGRVEMRVTKRCQARELCFGEVDPPELGDIEVDVSLEMNILETCMISEGCPAKGSGGGEMSRPKSALREFGSREMCRFNAGVLKRHEVIEDGVFEV